MTIAQIRAGLKTRLEAITGLRASSYWPDQINPPAALVKLVRGNANEDFEGDQVLTFEVIILAGPAQGDYERGQTALDLYLEPTGDKSVVAAIEGDPDLGGKADSTLVRGWSDYGVLEVNGVNWWGVKFEVEVYQ